MHYRVILPPLTIFLEIVPQRLASRIIPYPTLTAPPPPPPVPPMLTSRRMSLRARSRSLPSGCSFSSRRLRGASFVGVRSDTVEVGDVRLSDSLDIPYSRSLPMPYLNLRSLIDSDSSEPDPLERPGTSWSASKLTLTGRPKPFVFVSDVRGPLERRAGMLADTHDAGTTLVIPGARAPAGAVGNGLDLRPVTSDRVGEHATESRASAGCEKFIA